MAQRRKTWFQHIEEVSRNVVKTCRYYGISHAAYYRWYSRYQELGQEGLRDRSRRPRAYPRTTPWEVAERILCLRRHYHFGPTCIRMYLRRCHAVNLGQAGIWCILK